MTARNPLLAHSASELREADPLLLVSIAKCETIRGRYRSRVEACVSVTTPETPAPDDRQKSAATSGSLLRFMEAGVFGRPGGTPDERRVPGLGSRPPGHRSRHRDAGRSGARWQCSPTIVRETLLGG
jgi:hypothetical protein